MRGFMDRSQLNKLNSAVYDWLLRKNPDLLNKYLPKKLIKKTDKEIEQIIRKFKTLKEFREKHNSLYTIARTRKLSVLNELKSFKGSFSRAEVLKSALKYKTPKEWMKYDIRNYAWAQRKGLLNICTKHMNKQSMGYTKEECLKQAIKFKTIKEWKNTKKSTIVSARNKGKLFFKKCTAHMVRPESNKKKAVVNLKTKEIFSSVQNAMKKYKNCSKISEVCNGKRLTAGGYRWAYCDDKGRVLK